jgi:hypothetical protein
MKKASATIPTASEIHELQIEAGAAAVDIRNHAPLVTQMRRQRRAGDPLLLEAQSELERRCAKYMRAIESWRDSEIAFQTERRDAADREIAASPTPESLQPVLRLADKPGATYQDGEAKWLAAREARALIEALSYISGEARAKIAVAHDRVSAAQGWITQVVRRG